MKKNNILKRLFQGIVLDNIPFLPGILNNIKTPHKATVNDPQAGTGKIDYLRLLASAGVFIVLIPVWKCVLNGNISVDQYIQTVKEILSIFIG